MSDLCQTVDDLMMTVRCDKELVFTRTARPRLSADQSQLAARWRHVFIVACISGRISLTSITSGVGVYRVCCHRGRWNASSIEITCSSQKTSMLSSAGPGT